MPHLDCRGILGLHLHGVRRHRQPLPLLRTLCCCGPRRQRPAPEGLQQEEARCICTCLGTLTQGSAYVVQFVGPCVSCGL